MNAPPIRLSPDPQANEVDHLLDGRAEEALARFKEQWPPERCERLAGLMSGDLTAIAQVWDEALDRPQSNPADEAVRKLAKGHVAFNRGGFS